MVGESRLVGMAALKMPAHTRYAGRAGFVIFSVLGSACGHF